MEEGYWLKKIEFLGRPCQILMQSINGPCPLLAIANVLLLRGNIQIHEDYSNVSHEMLISLVTNYLVESTAMRSAQAHTDFGNTEIQIQGAISTLPRLDVGLNVNVKFQNIKDFEYTSEIEVFDLLEIPLVHGWIVDPQLREAQVIGSYSYNQLQEKLLALQEVQASEEENEELELISKFFDESASQLTFEGLRKLHDDLLEGTLGVLFRNNHFSTIYKYQGCIYALATDVGFIHEPLIIWERFNNISGNTSYCDSAFFECEFLQHRSENQPNVQSQSQSQSQPLDEDQKRIDEDASLALAIAMQEKFEQEQKEDLENQRAIEAADSGLLYIPPPPEMPLAPVESQPGFAPLPADYSSSERVEYAESSIKKKNKKKKKKCILF